MKKKFILFLWISWAFFSLFLWRESSKSDTPKDIPTHQLGDELRVMTWNLGSYCMSSRYYNGTYYKNAPKPESQRKNIAKTIAEINPDVLCIQEISADYLGLFQSELKAQNLEYPHTALLENLDKQRSIAILSKVEFKKLKKYDNIKFPYQEGTFESVRGLLLVKVDDIFIATLHAKSRRSFESYPQDKYCEEYREKELNAFAKILSHYKDEKLLLCGDFNEEASHANIQNFEIANLSLIPQGTSENDSWTYSYQNGKRTNCFDFFLATPTLSTKKPALILQDYKQASDHRAVYVDISRN